MEKYLSQAADEMRLRGYSPQTVKIYVPCLRNYFRFAGAVGLNPDEERIRIFLLGLRKRGLASQSVNLHLNALKFFYRHVMKSPIQISLRFSKRPKRLPIVLSREEIMNIIAALKNQKHKLLVGLAYGCGLRVSEVVRLQVRDVDFERRICCLLPPRHLFPGDADSYKINGYL